MVAGKREIVSSVKMEKCKISSFDLVVLDDGTVAETVTLTTDKNTTADYDVSSPFGATFSPGSIVLICIGTAAIIGVGVFFRVRKKKRNTTN